MTESIYNRSKVSQVMSYEAYCYLQQWIIDKYPNNPYPLDPKFYFYHNTGHREYLSRFIEEVILRMLRKEGADPIKAQDKGRYIPGQYGQKGHFVHQRGVRRGRADVVCFWRGNLCNFEVKVKNDRQSDDQKEEQRRAEANGEVYLIIKTVDDFLNYAFPGWNVNILPKT